jgi:hypothetical protein
VGVGGGDVGEQIIVIAISHEEYMFLLHFLSIPWCGEGVWGGGGGSVYFRHLYMCGWAGGGGWMWPVGD